MATTDQTRIFAGTFGEVIGMSSAEATSIDPADLISKYRAWDENNQIVEEDAE